jgi:hypothetical protein
MLVNQRIQATTENNEASQLVANIFWPKLALIPAE